MKKWLLCILAAVAISAASACANDNPPRGGTWQSARAAARLHDAHGYYGAGMMHMLEAHRLDFQRKPDEAAAEWRLAVESFELAAQADPGGVDIFQALIACYVRLGRGGEAIQSLEKLAAAIPETPEARLELAHTFRQLNLDQRAVDQYNKALQLAPEGSNIWRSIIVELASYWRAAGKPAQAAPLLNKALELFPQEESLRVELAFVSGESGDHARAIELLKPVLMAADSRLEPKDFSAAAFFLANEFEKAEISREGVDVFVQLLAVHPDDADVCQAAMLLMDSAGEPRRAIETGEDFLKRHPGSHAVRLILAAVHEKQGDLESALELYRRALVEAMPFRSVTTRQMLSIAESLIERGESDKGLDVILEALAVEGVSGELHVRASIRAAIMLRDREQVAKAIDTLRGVAEAPDADWRPLVLYAQLLQEMGRIEEADKILNGNLDRFAGKADALLHLYYSLGGLHMLDPQAEEKAEKYLMNALAIQRDHAPAANALAYMYSVRGRNLDRAEELINISLGQHPDEPAYIDTLGWIQYGKALRDDDLKRLENAVKNLEKAAVEEEDIILDHLGDAYYVAGQWEKAVEKWRQALELEARPGGEILDRESVNFKIEAVDKMLAEEMREHQAPREAGARIVRPLAPPPSKPPHPI